MSFVIRSQRDGVTKMSGTIIQVDPPQKRSSSHSLQEQSSEAVAGRGDDGAGVKPLIEKGAGGLMNLSQHQRVSTMTPIAPTPLAMIEEDFIIVAEEVEPAIPLHSRKLSEMPASGPKREYHRYVYPNGIYY